MSRPLRIEYENAFYHVISRGERRENIHTCPEDKEKFLKKLAETVEKYKLFLHAYVFNGQSFPSPFGDPTSQSQQGYAPTEGNLRISESQGSSLQIPEIILIKLLNMLK